MTTFLVALGVALPLTWVATTVLQRLRVIDVPNHRSSHVHPVPRGGGAAILPSVSLAVGLTGSWGGGLGAGAVGAALLGAVGLADDWRSVPALQRLLIQVVVSLGSSYVILAGITGDDAWIRGAAVLLGAVWLTGAVNVYNFMDGANGVAGLTALVAGAWFAYLGTSEDAEVLVVAGLAVAGASAGFIPWNFPRARVFMGDVGSYSVGFLLGALVLLTFVITGSATLSLAPLSVLLCDSAVTLARRIARGDPPMAAHREHVYQRLPGAGKGSPLPALVVSSVTVLCLAAALLPLTGTLAVWAVLLSVYLSLPRLLGSAGKRRVGVR